jgi:hypothetical protein
MPPQGAILTAAGVAAIGTLVAYLIFKKPSNASGGTKKVEARIAAAGIVLPPPGAPKVQL